MKNLKPHQAQALKFLLARKGGALFMEMRLGKTLTTIRAVKELNAYPALIVAPYGVMETWGLELADDGEDFTIATGSKEKRLKLITESKNNWVIVNYESIKRLNVHDLKKWRTVIFDESIKVANPKAQVTRYVLKYLTAIESRFVLCGLPTPENELQAVTQLIIANGHFLGYQSYWAVRNKFYIQAGYDWVPMGNNKTRIRDYIKGASFILSRQDAGIGSEKIYARRYVELNSEQKKQIKSVDTLYEFGEFETKNELGVMIAHHYIAGGLSCEPGHELINDAKLKELAYLLTTELKDEKVLVWCKYRAEQFYIHAGLSRIGINPIMVNGDVDVGMRDSLRLEFNDPTSLTNVALLTISSSAKGGDWSGASTSIYYSNDFSNDARLQSEDRIIHPEKREPVLLIDLLSKGSLDEEVLMALKEKKFDSQLVMNNYKQRLGIK